MDVGVLWYGSKTQPVCLTNMLTYASDLLKNVPEMEASDLFWDDLAGVQSIRQQYAERNYRPTFNQAAHP